MPCRRSVCVTLTNIELFGARRASLYDSKLIVTTVVVISKYQLIPLIIARVKQLNDGCRPFVKMNNGETDPEKIAIAEIVNNRFPLCLLINGNIVCRMSHFTHFPSDIM